MQSIQIDIHNPPLIYHRLIVISENGCGDHPVGGMADRSFVKMTPRQPIVQVSEAIRRE
jgi:hypothetical protein